ncbi:hypothetical protein J7L48_01415 [bacterium]|nr:hypothetical protein [bacterium]
MKKKVFIIYSSAEWSDEPYLNVHHYAKELSKLGHRVIFIESIGLRKPQISKSEFDKMRLFKRLLKLIFMPLRKRGNIFVLTPFYYPIKKLNILFSFILNLQLFFLCSIFKRIHWVFLPTFDRILKRKGKKELLIYHPVDRYSQNPGVNKKEIEQNELRIIKKADLIFTTTFTLKKKLEDISGKNVYLLRNNIVDCTLKYHKILPFTLTVKHPALVYPGNLASYNLDFTLITNMVKNNININFYFIGPRGKGENDKNIPFEREKNVHFISELPHKFMLDILKYFDAGFMPYEINHRTIYSFPMKYTEFLLAGLPIYTTKLPTLVNEKYLFFIKENDKINIEKYSNAKRGEVVGYARKFCWSKRIKDVLKIIEDNK